MTEEKSEKKKEKKETPVSPPAPEASTPHPEPEVSDNADATDNGTETTQERLLEITKKAASKTEEFVGESYHKAKEAIKKSNPRACVKFLDAVLQLGRDLCPPEVYDSFANWVSRFGHMSLVIAQVLSLVIFLIAAVELESKVLLLHGVGWAALLIVLQYTADKFLYAGKKLIESSPSKMASASFLDCTALLVEVIGLVAFFAILIEAGRVQQWNIAFVGLGILALCETIAIIAINPSMVNIEISEDVSAGEEALGILSFFAKAILRIVPIAFGVGAIVGVIGMAIGAIGILTTDAEILLQSPFIPGLVPLKLVVLVTCLPFASYAFFAFYHLTIDLLRAILEIPRKLEKKTRK